MRPMLALTSTAFWLGSGPTHTLIVPLVFVPTIENPLGVKVNLLDALVRLGLEATETP